MFATTHASQFGFGKTCDFATLVESANPVGEAIGAYVANLASLLSVPAPITAVPVLAGEILMKDVKYESLFRRFPLGDLRMDYAAGASVVLANVNYVHHVLRGLLSSGHAMFRLKFIVAYHADASLKVMQDALAARGSLPPAAQEFFGAALGNSDSRWLRKRRSLRNLLVHYLPDPRDTHASSVLTRAEAIERLSGGLDYSEIDALLDRHVARASRLLEAAFRLSRDTFWYGQVD